MNTVEETSPTPTKLGNLPISFFSVVMGLSGLTLAWEQAEQAAIMPFMASPYHALISGAVFVVLLGFYIAKYVFHRQAVLRELHIRCN